MARDSLTARIARVAALAQVSVPSVWRWYRGDRMLPAVRAAIERAAKRVRVVPRAN
jgi:DNA-binding transcriptional regulator YdaS (Cro superfamily)